jgi:hypothetical protein
MAIEILKNSFILFIYLLSYLFVFFSFTFCQNIANKKNCGAIYDDNGRAAKFALMTIDTNIYIKLHNVYISLQVLKAYNTLQYITTLCILLYWGGGYCSWPN